MSKGSGGTATLSNGSGSVSVRWSTTDPDLFKALTQGTTRVMVIGEEMTITLDLALDKRTP